MALWFGLVSTIAGIYTAFNIYCLAKNYRIAKQLEVPLLIAPVSPENPVWVLLGDSIISVIKRLFGPNKVTRFGIRGWIFYDKSRTALELGQHYAFVTPDKIWLYVCDAQTLTEVLQRRNDFPRPLESLAMLDVFGPNVATVEGTDWQRHRKITSAPFTEQHSNVVWAESIRQASQVLDFWVAQKSPITDTAKHIRILSLHVLSGAGFGKFYTFQKAAELPRPGHTFNYKDSLALVLDHIMLILVLGPKVLTNRFLPEKWTRVGLAMQDFKAYMKDMYTDEKRFMANADPKSATILTSLIRAAEIPDDEKSDQESAPAPPRGLSEAEIYGNIFVYNFAGHDTTAITFSWTLYLLAAHPEMQDWVYEEINEYLMSDDISSWAYAPMFQKFKRCFAVMLEVLRLFNPLTGIVKSTGETPVEITISGKRVILPAGIRVILNTEAIHTLPCYWGSDSLEWNPKRWIVTPRGSNPTLESEQIITPQPGTYTPWSGGSRVCPGKKFSQVEFVAVMVTFFRRNKVEPVPHTGESIESARARTVSAVKDSGMILLLQMLKPESIGLRWERRK